MKMFLITLVAVLIATVSAQPAKIDCAVVRCKSPECPASQWFTPPGACCPICGPANCAAQSCLIPDCLVTETPPGECCPVCVLTSNTCTYNGVVYQDRQTFMKDCNTCRCRMGLQMCTKMACPPKTCTINGVVYQEGETFKIDCNGCTCRNGMPLCTLIACPPKTCTHNGVVYQDGETFMKDCNTCHCRDGMALCTKKGCLPTTCTYNGVVYQDGQTFMKDCNTCTCSNGIHVCTEMACLPGTCTYRGEYFQNGETFTKECNKCRCINGRELCTRRRCPPTDCNLVDCMPLECPFQDQVTLPGQCCPICRVTRPGCRQGDRFYPEGASVPSTDPCETACVCRDSNISCAVMDCARPPCGNPTRVEGRCCPVCDIIDGYPSA